MITLDDLNAAIAECQGERNPNANTCYKLAAYLTIRNELYGKERGRVDNIPVGISGYSMSAPQEVTANQSIIETTGGSDFLNAISGREQSAVLPILDDLMSTLYAIEPRLYARVMHQLAK